MLDFGFVLPYFVFVYLPAVSHERPDSQDCGCECLSALRVRSNSTPFGPSCVMIFIMIGYIKIFGDYYGFGLLALHYARRN